MFTYRLTYTFKAIGIQSRLVSLSLALSHFCLSIYTYVLFLALSHIYSSIYTCALSLTLSHIYLSNIQMFYFWPCCISISGLFVYLFPNIYICSISYNVAYLSLNISTCSISRLVAQLSYHIQICSSLALSHLSIYIYLYLLAVAL